MGKSPDAFRSIGEVARLVGVAPHVLRYWEGQFTQLSPVKRADGRRYYRPEDVQLAAGLCEVMREEGLTIRGAKRLIAADRGVGLRSRGAARLKESAGLDFGSDENADRNATSARAVAANLAGATPTPTVQSRRHASPVPMPLLAEPASSSAAENWLHRLNRVAADLRQRATPLPADARAAAQDLRALLARR